MSPTRAAVVDLDGTVWRGQRLVDGADAGLATLRERMPVVFLTNGTGLRPERFADRLEAVGEPLRPRGRSSSGPTRSGRRVGRRA